MTYHIMPDEHPLSAGDYVAVDLDLGQPPVILMLDRATLPDLEPARTLAIASQVADAIEYRRQRMH